MRSTRILIAVPVLLLVGSSCLLLRLALPRAQPVPPDPLVRAVHEMVDRCEMLPLGPLGEVRIGSVRDVVIVSQEQTPDGTLIAFEGICANPATFRVMNRIRGTVLVGRDGRAGEGQWVINGP